MSFPNRRLWYPHQQRQTGDNPYASSPQKSSISNTASTPIAAEEASFVYKRRPSQLVLDFRSNDVGSAFLDHENLTPTHQQHPLVPKHIGLASGNGVTGKSDPMLPLRERCLSDGDESLRLVSNTLPPITAVDHHRRPSGAAAGSSINKALTIKSITKSSVSSGNLSLSSGIKKRSSSPSSCKNGNGISNAEGRFGQQGLEDSPLFDGIRARGHTFSSSSYRLQQQSAGNNFTELQTKSALLEGSPVLKGARLCKDTSCQTDHVSDTELFPQITNESIARVIKDEYTTPGIPSEDEDSEMEQMEWLADADASSTGEQVRPSAPDVEMMTCGHRLERVVVSPLEEDKEMDQSDGENETKDFDDDDDQSVAYLALIETPPPSPRSNGSSNFRILAPVSCRRPKPRRFLPQQRVYVEYHPTSPPSSERTVPSETGSETSSYFSAVPSSVSSPDSTKIINLLLNKGRSAFTQPATVTPPSTVVPFKLSLAMTPSTPVSSALKAIPSTTVCTNTIASKTGGNAADC